MEVCVILAPLQRHTPPFGISMVQWRCTIFWGQGCGPPSVDQQVACPQGVHVMQAKLVNSYHIFLGTIRKKVSFTGIVDCDKNVPCNYFCHSTVKLTEGGNKHKTKQNQELEQIIGVKSVQSLDPGTPET